MFKEITFMKNCEITLIRGKNERSGLQSSFTYTEHGITSGPGAVSFTALLFIVFPSSSGVISSSILM